MEVFRYVPNFEDYMVSDLGNVKSLKRKKAILLKQGTDKDGYKRVILLNNNNRKTFYVHQLVVMAFLNHIPSSCGLIVNHINFKRDDNRLENLELVTHRENSSKTIRTTKHVGVRKTKSGKFSSIISVNKERIYLGTFNTEEEAFEYYENALNALDNNTEIITKRQESISKLRGVSYIRSTNKWSSEIWIKGKKIYLGCFNTKEEAYEYYNKAKEAIKNGEEVLIKKATFSSKYKNICFSSKVGKWLATIRIDGNIKHIGYFLTEEEAYIAQQEAYQKHLK